SWPAPSRSWPRGWCGRWGVSGPTSRQVLANRRHRECHDRVTKQLPDLSPKPGELDANEYATREQVEAIAFERLQWTLRHAYEHVPFYRQSFDAAGVRPEDVRGFADLARLPF